MVYDCAMNNTALSKAFTLFGSQAKLARALNIAPMAVSKWKTNGVPPERALEIERLTSGAITRQDLRPDLFGLAALETQ